MGLKYTYSIYDYTLESVGKLQNTVYVCNLFKYIYS